MRTARPALALALALAACSAAPPKPVDTAAIAVAAHEAYVTAINSNDLDKLLAVLTDDVVYLAPHEPAVVGKAAVREWGAGYFRAFRTRWEKTTDEFFIAGEWGIERYSYKSTDTPIGGGEAMHDTGKGINIYHRDADGVWRVARDAWNSDLPVPTR